MGGWLAGWWVGRWVGGWVVKPASQGVASARISMAASYNTQGHPVEDRSSWDVG